MPIKCIAPESPANAAETAPLVTKFVLFAVTAVSIALVLTALVPLPINTSPLANVCAPVPPRATPRIPSVNLLVFKLGISAAVSALKVGAPAAFEGAANT
jgi:hypothetical protein